MILLSLLLPTLAFAPVATSANVHDQICERILIFETTKPAPTDNLKKRRYVEFHWGFDPEAIFSWGCLHSADQVSKTTCDWLMQHTNQEFSMLLPMRIMGCFGYRFPKHADYDWNDMLGSIELQSKAGHRLILDLNYRDLPEGSGVAMRLAIDDYGHNYEPAELPPIGPMPTDSAAAPKK